MASRALVPRFISTWWSSPGSATTRGQSGAPFNVNEVFDKFVNIASQRNTGVDVAVNLRQDMGGLGTLSFTADMTWQLKDDFQLLPTSPVTSDNGEAGSPSWVGDFRVNWETPMEITVFYGLNVIGDSYRGVEGRLAHVAEPVAQAVGAARVHGPQVELLEVHRRVQGVGEPPRVP